MDSKRNGTVWVAAALGMLAAVGTARADIITVQGSTSGAFFNGATVSSPDHLTFTGGSFGPIGSDQMLRLSALNGVVLNNGTETYDPFTFLLTVTFTLPVGAFGDPIAADITGSVHGNDGHVTFNFSDSPTHFSFGSGGSFDLLVQDLTVDLDNNQGRGTLQGHLSNVTAASNVNTQGDVSAVPEPGSLILMMTALLGCVALSLRRKLAR